MDTNVTSFCCVSHFFLFLETSLVHWAHGIEDANALDVVAYYYLFGFLNVRIQYNQ